MKMLSDGGSIPPASTITRAYEHLEITWVAHVFALTVKAERP